MGSTGVLHKQGFASVSLSSCLHSTFPGKHSVKIAFSPKILLTFIIFYLIYLVILLCPSYPLIHICILLYTYTWLDCLSWNSRRGYLLVNGAVASPDTYPYEDVPGACVFA